MNSKDKGKRGELEVVRIMKAHGIDARRTAQYCGNSGEAADVVGLDGFHIEVKRCEVVKIYDWLHQAERDHKEDTVPVVVFRKNSEPWHAVLPLDDFLNIIKNR